MKRVFLAGASILAMAAILLGIPAGLIAVAGNPLADIASWGQYLTSADIGSVFLLKIFLPLVGWVCWASFALPLILEIITHLLHKPSIKLPAALSWQQGLAAVLIGLVISTSVGASIAPVMATPSVSSSAGVNPQVDLTAERAGLESSTAQSQHHAADQQGKTPSVRYQVHGYETLWDIAHKTLGDGNRYVEILSLNMGQIQPDGAALDQTQLLHEGWILTLPADAQLPAPQQSVITVQEGDTLSGIAQQQYGDYEAYHQIAAQNAGVTQADGTTLTDADIIQPGWQLTLPGDGAAATSPSEVPAQPAPEQHSPKAQENPQTPASPSESTPQVPQTDSQAPQSPEHSESAAPAVPAPEGAPEASSAPQSASPQHAPSEPDTPTESAPANSDTAEAPTLIPGTSNEPSEATSPAADTASHTTEEESAPWATFAGVGALLAGGILAAVAARRFYQRRRRLPGQDRDFSDDAYDTYTALAHEAYSTGDRGGIEDIHSALRILSNHAYDTQSPAPELNLITVDEHTITLYLASPASLPFPYTPREDGTVWDIALSDIPDYVPEAPALYPALATLGTDRQQRLILLNLEQANSLSVNAPEPVAASIFAAYATEIVANPWADNLRLSLVGHHNQLAQSLGGSRVSTYSTEQIEECIRALESEATAARDFLTRHGYTSPREIPLSADTEAFTPHIVMVSESVDEASRMKIHKIIQGIPRAALAVISQDTPGSSYSITAQVHPHELDPTAVLEPLGITFTPQYLTETELQSAADLLQETSQEPTGTSLLSEEPDPADTPRSSDSSAVVGDSLEDAADELLISQYLTPTTAAQLLAPTLTDGQSIGSRHPFLALLGPVRLLDPAGQAPTGSNGKVSPTTTARTVALTAFLNLNPQATTEQYHQAFWPGKHYALKSATSSRNKLTNQTRTYLGKDPEGNDYLPHASGVYNLSSSIMSDWDIFQHLIGTNIATASTTSLFAALKLVRGAPLSGVKERHYTWAEAIRETMLDTIIDVAYELAARSLRTGDTQTARVAARIGRELDPANEALWRASLQAESIAGNKEAAQQLVQDLAAYLEQFDDEMTEQTEQLIQDLNLVGV
ncbi:hypothetical protein HMPREF3164_04750 [Rothia sp. HMSC08A08]|uniref:LysM peptidoglycan-binding domain-containing protein n=1 Tax=Rothia sp. HMSC08A08 TaxID=1581132 RepID=UPI0008A25326|nr:LysM peptidoglycan-binding domain-containing protein [Rothia sp. HMSC08A08]OFS80868.1 hypothetical protein HMPREF3164_04750 [Rothia sp. HMSC08A08]